MTDVKNWMRSLSDDTPLCAITIPGTHNSASRFVSASWITKCQHTDIPRQLDMGVRLLDIRMELKGNTFTVVHAIIDCRKKRFLFSEKITFADVLQDCLSFLDAHPTETLLVSIKEDDGHNGDVFFERFYKQFIHPNKDRWYLKNEFPPLGECRGKIVLLRRCGLGNCREQTDTGLDFSHWPDQGNRESSEPKICDLHNGKQTCTVQDRYAHYQKEKWEKCIVPAMQKAVADKNTACLHATSTAGGLLPFVSSRYINRRLLSYLNGNRRYYGWFMADFITQELCESIIACNDGITA
ncbi:MAG: phosphatidylinositol-specific phospholipase C domain-containing protein [Clostridia bacterium]|nr:phosphatidylinositol-specific phospholipase C domain-containing protein [Clostridia bacterium]